jgi:hypothetical protein
MTPYIDNITMCDRVVGSFDRIWLDILGEIMLSGVAEQL